MKIDLDKTTTVSGTRYPPPYDTPCRDRVRQVLGDAAGLTQFGVNLLRLTPGTWASGTGTPGRTSSSTWSPARSCW